MIKLLDQLTINKIAAGEVIERPSSVVKELVENSIDAGATAVTVEIKEGGLSFIRITDNGLGIEKAQVKTAFLRHATSKINKAEDLFTVGSLGFRGEALASIAAVAQVEMVTKTESDMTGVRYIIEGGKELDYQEIGCPEGTTIIIRNLFYNTPARRKFMKSATTEASYIAELINRLAMSRPEVSFKFINNGQNKLFTSGNNNLKDIIYNIYGKDIAKNLVEVNGTYDDITLTGYIAKPYISKGNRTYENYFVNNRYIKSSVITKAIEEAYKTFVMTHKYPFTALKIEINKELLDINVHPTKMELKISNTNELYSCIINTLREALTEKELIPNVSVGNDREAKKDISKNKIVAPEPFEVKRREANYGNVRLNSEPIYKPREVREISNYNVNKDVAVNEQINKSEPKITEQNQVKPIDGNIEISKTNIENQDVVNQSMKIDDIKIIASKDTDIVREIYGKTVTSENINITKENDAKPIVPEDISINKKDLTTEHVNLQKTNTDNNYNQEATITKDQVSLFEDKLLSEESRSKHKLIGQLFKTYWLIEYENKLFIMDQHAAHEKVMFERLMKLLKTSEIFSQNIMPSIIISLTPREIDVLTNNMDIFERLGFVIEEFGGNEYVIRAVPANIMGVPPKELFEEFIGDLLDDANKITDTIFVEKLATMACKAAIKGNTAISYQEADALIDELLTLDNPYNCPHGRPTIITMSEQDIEKKFRRIQN